MALSTLSIQIDNYPATEIAPHSPPVFETWADGGCGSLSFDFAMSSKRGHHLLYPGALVVAKVGMQPVFSGRLSEPDRSTWECVAYGHASHAGKLPALDGGGNMTRDVAVATTTARAWGWQGSDPWGVATGTVAGDDTGPVMLGDLLKQRADELGQRTGVDARGRIFFRTDPTAPTLYLAPDAKALGQSDEGMASHIGARYLGIGGAYATSIRPSGGEPVQAMELIDLTERGEMTSGEADAILDGLLAKGRTKPAWTSGMTVHRSQLQSRGVPPFLPMITAGVDMVRLFGLPATLVAAGTTIDAVIGKTRFDAATPDLVYLEPINTAPRTFGDVIAAA